MSFNGSAASDWDVGSKRKPVELLSSDESESEGENAWRSTQKRSRLKEGSHGTIVSPIAIDIDEDCHDVASSFRARVSEFGPGTSEVQRNHVSNTLVSEVNNSMAPSSGSALASSLPVADSRTQSRFSSSKVVLVSRLSAIRSYTPHTAYLGQAKMHGFDFHVYPFTNMKDVTRRFGYSYTTIVSADHPDLCYLSTTGDAASHGCGVNIIHNVGGGSSSGQTDVDTASVATDTSASETTSILTDAAAFTVPVGTNTDTASKATTSTNSNKTNTSNATTSTFRITATDRTTTSSNTTSNTSSNSSPNTTSNTHNNNATSNTTSLTRQVVLVSPECGVKESSHDISTSSPGCLGRARAGKYEYFVFRFTNMRDINHRFGLGCTSIVSIDDPYLRFIEWNKSTQPVDAITYDDTEGNVVPNDSVIGEDLAVNKKQSEKKAKRVRFASTTASYATASSTTSATIRAPPATQIGNTITSTALTILPRLTTTLTHINIHQVQQYFTELNAMDDNTLRSRYIDPRAFRAVVSAQVKLTEALIKMMSWK